MDLRCVVCVYFLLRVGLIGVIVDFFPGPNDVLVAEKIVEAVEKERFSSLSVASVRSCSFSSKCSRAAELGSTPKVLAPYCGG